MERLLAACFVCLASSSRMMSSEADHVLPALTDLTYIWNDPFTLTVSWRWEKPAGLQGDQEVFFELDVVNMKTRDKPLSPLRTKSKTYTYTFLSEEMGSMDQWQLNIKVRWSSDSLRSRTKSITVNAIKPRDELVKDFKCLVADDKMTCSWIPTEPNVKASYRYCGTSTEDIRSLKRCEQNHSVGERKSCLMQADPRQRDVCVLVENDVKLKTFKPDLVVPVPKVTITEDGDNLNLMWIKPNVGEGCGWEYVICYKECNRPQPCQTYKATKGSGEHGPWQVPYNKHCLYEFKFNVSTDKYCTPVRSDGSGFIEYGDSRPFPNSLTSTIGVAVTLCLSLSVTVILSAYCCRKHSAVFFPLVPDTSPIFKDVKSPAGKLYTIVPQPEEICRITVVTESDSLYMKWPHFK